MNFGDFGYFYVDKNIGYKVLEKGFLSKKELIKSSTMELALIEAFYLKVTNHYNDLTPICHGISVIKSCDNLYRVAIKMEVLKGKSGKKMKMSNKRMTVLEKKLSIEMNKTTILYYDYHQGNVIRTRQKWKLIDFSPGFTSYQGNFAAFRKEKNILKSLKYLGLNKAEKSNLIKKITFLKVSKPCILFPELSYLN